ncbi:30S ribosomal protein S17 [Candidatus Pacearchaeota archaeon]|jgi:small subunit ribosomal protein S17|nr:30S ribosomal protein S17 [Candidatus Pacearchaeota archaeon]|tara:strand:- start:11570 stop:11896 length:327 start_codon:yes stop_codon:yes gene_type:complete
MAEKTKVQKEKSSQEATKTIVGTRGRVFEGQVVKKFPHRVVIEFERVVKIQKYERFHKKKTRIHARLPEGLPVDLHDIVQAQECRPLSKIVHFIVLKVIKKAPKEEAA